MTTDNETTVESQPFQAEVSELLHLMVHSVYSETDIFLRELISNGSDACDKLRYEAIAHPDLIADGAPPDIRIAPDKKADTLVVTDSGIGMDAETKARAFEPFFTTKEKGKGTGLGLSTVYGVVKQSGGYIDIYSAPGAGTTFKIYLPRVQEAITADAPAGTATSFTGNETILLAEDETSLRTLTRNTLELCGYKVLEAKDGVEALEVSDRYKGPIDLLLTDMVMPGMGGHALAQELTRRRPEIRLAFMSGYTGQSVGSQGPLDPGSVFLMKPFTRELLTRKIREALDRRVVQETI